MLHKIKSWPKEFQSVLDGDKRHKVRRNDRNYQQGDYIILQEYNPKLEEYTGREIRAVIYNITQPGTFGLPNDICVFTFAIY